jgi:hypothetical protein
MPIGLALAAAVTMDGDSSKKLALSSDVKIRE